MTPPSALVGFAVLALLWLPLWWLAGGRRPFTWVGLAAVAAAFMALAVDHRDLVFGANALIWAGLAARRWDGHRQARHDDDGWSNQTLAERTTAAPVPAPGAPTLDLLETCHGPGGPPITALRRRRRRRAQPTRHR